MKNYICKLHRENKTKMRKFNTILLFTIFFYNWAGADEGMWLPSLIYKLNIADMQKMGLELNAEDIYSINNSICHSEPR